MCAKVLNVNKVLLLLLFLFFIDIFDKYQLGVKDKLKKR